MKIKILVFIVCVQDIKFEIIFFQKYYQKLIKEKYNKFFYKITVSKIENKVLFLYYINMAINLTWFYQTK